MSGVFDRINVLSISKLSPLVQRNRDSLYDHIADIDRFVHLALSYSFLKSFYNIPKIDFFCVTKQVVISYSTFQSPCKIDLTNMVTYT